MFVFPAIYAEGIASANTPAIKLLNPLVLLLFGLVYGLAALLLRDLWVRRQINWWQAILLGAVYAAFNEGIVADTWFKAKPLALTAATAARMHGVNWHLVVNLIIFHSVFSMLIPIVLSFVIFPSWRDQPLLKTWGTGVSLLSLFIIAASDSFLTRHGELLPDHTQRTTLLMIMGVVALVAVAFPTKQLELKQSLQWNQTQAYVAGLVFALLFTLSYFGTTRFTPTLSILLSLVFVAYAYKQLHRLAGANNLDSKKILLMIAWATTPSALLSLTRIGTGQPVLVVLFGLGLWWLHKRLVTRATV